MRRLAGAALLAAVLAAPACGHENQPSPSTFTGSWSGTASDSSGSGTVEWQVQQSGSTFSGTLRMTDDSSGARGLGTVSGALSGSAVDFSISIPTGGFDDPWTGCAANLTGTATLDGSSLAGTYVGSNSCSGDVTDGRLTLNRR